MSLLTLCLFQLFFLLISGNFKIYLNQTQDSIPYAIANYGDIPYGKKLLGRLVLAEPLDGCKSIKFQNLDPADKAMKFVLISRGNCTFVQKSYQAQLIGAKMAIIYDNIEELSEQIIMVEDGHGDEVTIPTILIHNSIGEQLKEIIEKNQTKYINAAISFDIGKQQVVNYEFWLNIRNRESYKLIRDFKDYALELHNQTSFQPHYFIDRNFFGEGGIESNDCYSNGKYCFMDPDGWGPANGRDMIDEILRQICINIVNQQQWWEYMDQIERQCIKYADLKNCGKKVMENIGIDLLKVGTCQDRSFVGKNNNDRKNYRLDTEMDASKGRSLWPGVTVNGINYHGNLKKSDILEVVCQGFKDQPEICRRELDRMNTEIDDSQGMSKPSFIIMVIVLLFCFFLFLIICFRRWYHKELANQMEQKVNPMVNQYMQFYETKQQIRNDI